MSAYASAKADWTGWPTMANGTELWYWTSQLTDNDTKAFAYAPLSGEIEWFNAQDTYSKRCRCTDE